MNSIPKKWTTDEKRHFVKAWSCLEEHVQGSRDKTRYFEKVTQQQCLDAFCNWRSLLVY